MFCDPELAAILIQLRELHRLIGVPGLGWRILSQLNRLIFFGWCARLRHLDGLVLLPCDLYLLVLLGC